MDFIDPHLHFFALSQGMYNWLQPNNPPFWSDKHTICRDFGEADLRINAPLKLAAYVHVEAGFDNENSLAEAEFWLKKAGLPLSTIITVNLNSPPDRFRKTISEALVVNQGQPSAISGVRHILDEQAASILSHPNTRENFKLLCETGLIFELQMDFADAKSFSALSQVLNDYPSIHLSINHAGSINWQQNIRHINNWRHNMREVSNIKQCFVKVSGFEMQNRSYSDDDVKRVIDETLNVVGEDKTMMASNFPLVLLSKPYDTYWQAILQNLRAMGLSTSDLMYNNAARCYAFAKM
ncbi:amidohydrolase family protein [Agaribacter flavus]|uniref:Amidohydrolase family protein n=1 Tax=Agaribacter flavus TaxID=1902781 RepID=A0ABV7FS00_9ALTE